MELQATREMEPLYVVTYWEMGRVYYLMGKYSESVAILEDGIRLVGRLPILLMYAGASYAMLGQHDVARGIAAELRAISEQRYISPMYEAHVARALGEHDRAESLVERAYELRSGWLMFTRADPLNDPRRDDPCFHEWLRKLGLDF